jgi:hypothetical protein
MPRIRRVALAALSPTSVGTPRRGRRRPPRTSSNGYEHWERYTTSRSSSSHAHTETPTDAVCCRGCTTPITPKRQDPPPIATTPGWRLGIIRCRGHLLVSSRRFGSSLALDF